MRFENVCIESFGYTIPENVVSSQELESRLEPIYTRLRLPQGRLELMTGIQERRVWNPGTLPSEKSIESGNRAIEIAGIDRAKIGCLIHGSVCRDHLEPATACKVHHHLSLPKHSTIYDTSNACLGIMNGMVQAANMIELGQVQAALVVGTENSRALMETTIDALNRDTSWTRQQIKLAVASLTIGSASCAVLLTHSDISKTQNRIMGATAYANTEFHELCQSGHDEAGDGMRPLMTTDSEQLMARGVETGATTFESFLKNLGWNRDEIGNSFCHQVGTSHRKLMLDAMSLNPESDFTTLEWLGNTGSAALPVTMAIGLQEGVVEKGSNVAMLGIGSGINSLMIGVNWQETLVAGNYEPSAAMSK